MSDFSDWRKWVDRLINEKAAIPSDVVLPILTQGQYNCLCRAFGKEEVDKHPMTVMPDYRPPTPYKPRNPLVQYDLLGRKREA